MSLYSTTGAQALGGGQRMPAGSLTDNDFATLLSGYRRSVASSYRAIRPDELSSLPPGALKVSPKIDGELWFLVFDGSEAFLANSKGGVIAGNIPLLAEAKGFASRAGGRTVLAGELFALTKDGRPRVGDLAHNLAGGKDANVAVVGFSAFDLVDGGAGDKVMPLDAYDDRLAALETLLEGGKRVRAVKTQSLASSTEVEGLFTDWVAGGKAEGLVIRGADGRIFKLKPVVTIDAVVVGYTQRGDDQTQVRSILLGLMREGDGIQLMGACGNLGTDDQRKALLKQLEAIGTESSFRRAASDGSLYLFVKPEVVVEIRGTDIQSENAVGDPIRNMVLSYDNGWTALRNMPCASLLHPVLERVRDDKAATREEIRIEQVLDRCLVLDTESVAEAISLPGSELLRREVYSKESKGERSVRKLMVWKTNKESDSKDYPAFVVHWTDYAPGRKAPIKHTVKPAPTQALADELAAALIEKNIKKGWARAGDPS